MIVGSAHCTSFHTSAARGFTLLEVMITLALLAVMMVSVSLLLRGSLDMRLSLSERTTVNSRLNIALENLKRDLEHVYLLSVNRDKELMKDGINYTFFKLTDFAGTTSLSFTTMVSPAYSLREGEGELQRVIYELKESPTFEGRSALYRGSLPVGVKDDLKSQLMMEGIRSLSFEMWTGSGWSRQWDSSKADYRDHLPALVRVVIVAYLQDPEDADSADELDTEILIAHPGERRTIVYLPWSQKFPLLKPPSTPASSGL